MTADSSHPRQSGLSFPIIFSLPVAILLLGGCHLVPVCPGHTCPPITRSEAIRVANLYADHTWIASERNLFEGLDPDGIYVDTPDFTPGRSNRGVPYQWGGWVAIDEFDAAVAAGKYAGDLFCEKADESRFAVGVDCSGLISRCWDLPVKHSTRSLPGICVRLKDPRSLLPGDILNRFNRHVVLFKEFTDESKTTIRCYEATGDNVVRSEYILDAMLKRGFKPWRYKNIRD